MEPYPAAPLRFDRRKLRRLLIVLSVLAVATLLITTADFGIYVHELVAGGPPRMAVPMLERIAALLLVAWMIASSFVAPRIAGPRHLPIT